MKLTMIAFLYLIPIAATLLGCVPHPEATDSVAPADQARDTLTTRAAIVGEVRIVGSAPVNVQTVIRTEEGSVRVTGALAGEVARLGGARVVVHGQVRPSPDPIVDREVSVERYEVLSIDGRPVIVGEIVEVRGADVVLRTDGGEEITLRGSPPEFRVGQRVWVQGPASVSVQSHGTIRP